MMQITRSGEYGLRGLLFLAARSSKEITLVSEISKEQNIPETFLAKIFQRLSKAGVLRSVRGAKGGFYLGKPAKQITMREVLETLEGPIALNRCLLKEGQCEEEKECSFHPVWAEVQERLLDVLEKTTMEDLVRKMNRNKKQRRR